MNPGSNRKPVLGQRSTQKKKHVTSMRCNLEPAIWSRNTGQRIPCFYRCQLIITCGCPISKKYTVNQGCMSLSTYYLEYGRHLARLHRRGRRRSYAPMSNTASRINQEKIHSWVTSCFLYDYGAPLGGPFRPPELRYEKVDCKYFFSNFLSFMHHRRRLHAAFRRSYGGAGDVNINHFNTTPFQTFSIRT